MAIRDNKTSETALNWYNGRPWVGVFQGAKCDNIPKGNPVHLFIFLFLSPNVSALLVLDTGHLRIPVIARVSEPLYEFSAGRILLHTAFGATQSVLLQCITQQLCKGFRNADPQGNSMSQSTKMTPLVSTLFRTFLNLLEFLMEIFIC